MQRRFQLGKPLRLAALLATGWLIGYMAWGPSRSPALAVIVPFLFVALAPLGGLALVAGYYAAAVRGVVTASSAFFAESGQPVLVGLALWLGLVFLLVLPWGGAAWARKRVPGASGLLAVAAMVLLVVPPLGIIGAVNPFLGLGWIVPGSGWIGLSGMALALALLPLQPRAYQHGAVAVLAAVAAILTPTDDREYDRHGAIHAVSTHWGEGPKTADGVAERLTVLGNLARRHIAQGARAVVFPELVIGQWQDSFRTVWRYEIEQLARKSQAEIAVGMALPSSAGGVLLENSLVKAYPTGQERVSARQTVPVSMYRPLSDTGYPRDWSRQALIELDGKRALVLFCYEEYLPAMTLMHLWKERPDLIVGVSNTWWSANSSGAVVEKRHSESIARLFRLPYLRAENS